MSGETRTRAPARIWATVNGASTRLPDGGRMLVGGWTEDKDRPHAVEYVRADLADDLTTAYMVGVEDGKATRAAAMVARTVVERALTDARELILTLARARGSECEADEDDLTKNIDAALYLMRKPATLTPENSNDR